MCTTIAVPFPAARTAIRVDATTTTSKIRIATATETGTSAVDNRCTASGAARGGSAEITVESSAMSGCGRDGVVAVVGEEATAVFADDAWRSGAVV